MWPESRTLYLLPGLREYNDVNNVLCGFAEPLAFKPLGHFHTETEREYLEKKQKKVFHTLNRLHKCVSTHKMTQYARPVGGAVTEKKTWSMHTKLVRFKQTWRIRLI